MPTENPVAGKGQKDIDCEHYLGCLAYAARVPMAAFNCESCDCFPLGKKEKPGGPLMENKKICEKCSEKPSISKFSKYCSSCLNSFKTDKEKAPGKPKRKKVSIDKALPEKVPETPKREKASSGTAKPEKAPRTPDTAVRIEFGKYISVFKEVEKLADEEMRPVDMQIIYMLKKQLDHAEGG